MFVPTASIYRKKEKEREFVRPTNGSPNVKRSKTVQRGMDRKKIENDKRGYDDMNLINEQARVM